MAIDLRRRKAVMGRSMRLGHCVCNPKNPCPCDVFKEHNVCPCAGESLPARKDAANVALTHHVRRAGCASKIGQGDLLRIIERLPKVEDPNVLIGAAAGDDAGVYRLGDVPRGQCLVQTVDVFTPCVDDPYLFGRIAAANSLSDVYAMGGRPITALSIVGFPIDDLAPEILESMLRGGMEALAEAGCALIGGHSVNDEEIKFGYAITGLIGAAQVVARQGARAGDALVLTKPLGTGMIAFAAQIGRIRAEAQAEAAASMAALNRDAAELMTRLGAHACTDVTGFGLAGHLLEMMRSSGTTAEIDLGALPVFAAVPECIRLDVVPGAIEKNQEYAGAWVRAEDAAAESNLCVFFDPQTSGGLLIALPEAEADAIVKELRERGHAGAARIGSVCESMPGSPPGTILVRETEFQNMHGTQGAILMSEKAESPTPSKQFASSVSSAQAAPELSPCCDHPPEAPGSTVPSAAKATAGAIAAGGGGGTGAQADSIAEFSEFMKAANAPGAVDARAKKLIAIALSIARHCAPCLKLHIRSALQMGLSRAEIDEAAALVIAFCGCPAMMFYREIWAQIESAASAQTLNP